MGWLKFSQFWRLRRRSSHEWSWHSLVSVGSHFESDLLQTWLLMILFKAISSFSVPCLYFVNLICMICTTCYTVLHLLLAVLQWEFQEGKGPAMIAISHSSREPTWHDLNCALFTAWINKRKWPRLLVISIDMNDIQLRGSGLYK